MLRISIAPFPAEIRILSVLPSRFGVIQTNNVQAADAEAALELWKESLRPVAARDSESDDNTKQALSTQERVELILRREVAEV